MGRGWGKGEGEGCLSLAQKRRGGERRGGGGRTEKRVEVEGQEIRKFTRIFSGKPGYGENAATHKTEKRVDSTKN